MPGPTQKPRIYVVDDEKVIATTIGLILDKSGFQSRSFTDPREALRAAIEEVPDLLISDVAMPGMTGVDLAINLMEKCPKCKVLLFSGQAMTADLLEKARKQGHSFELLSKPVHPKDLLDAIKRTTRRPF